MIISKFDEFITESGSNIEDVYVDPEVTDSDLLDEAYDLARRRDVTILSGKELHVIKVDRNDNTVAGALFTESNRDTFSFDIAVHRDYENMGLGSSMVETAMDQYEEMQWVFPDIKMELHVINPKMKRMLEEKYGLAVKQKLGRDEWLMGD